MECQRRSDSEREAPIRLVGCGGDVTTSMWIRGRVRKSRPLIHMRYRYGCACATAQLVRTLPIHNPNRSRSGDHPLP
jgi:hypothetical protein